MRILGFSTNNALGLITLLLPLEVHGQTCKADCQVSLANGDRLVWVQKEFTTTITAATVVKIVNTDLHTTRLSTIHNKIPDGYTVPTNTNAEGTQTVDVTYTRSGKVLTTKVAFPTEFNEFPNYYTWYGTAPTTDAGGKSICATVETASVMVDYWTQDTSFTTPTHSDGPDPGGLMFTTHYEGVGGSYEIYRSAFPKEYALHSCSPQKRADPIMAELTARFIIATSTSYEGEKSSNGKDDSDTSLKSDGDSAPDDSNKDDGKISRVTSIKTLDGQSSVVTLDGQTVTVVPTAAAGNVGDSSGMAPQTPVTMTMTSTSLSTYVTEGPSGPVTLTSSVEVVNVVVSTPVSGPGDTNRKPGVQGSGAEKTLSSSLLLTLAMPLLLSSFMFLS